MKLLEGKTAIVTGAARGIGEAIALKFAENGANVAFTYVSDSSAEKAKALEEKLTALGVKAKAYQSNAGDFAACEVFVNDVLKEFGAVDICVNNAGISKDNLLLRMTPEQWDEGRTSGGRHPVSPWGTPTKGYKTRNNKRTDDLIVRKRK